MSFTWGLEFNNSLELILFDQFTLFKLTAELRVKKKRKKRKEKKRQVLNKSSALRQIDQVIGMYLIELIF